jgi:sulfate transport system ATP-binding protein
VKISATDVSKRFGAFAALDRVNLEVRSGELLALLGPSGSGKTTLLRIIAGLDWPDEGQVLFDGEDALKRSAGERHVGFVFQHYALFRHMTVFENIAFGLRVKPRHERPSEEEIRARVQKLLSLVQLGWLADRHPNQLSGGQRQRIALARALAIEPRLLLLDEVLAGLNPSEIRDIVPVIRAIRDRGVTIVLIEHVMQAVMSLAEQVLVLAEGRIIAEGSPQAIASHPRVIEAYLGHGAAGRMLAAGGDAKGAGDD